MTVSRQGFYLKADMVDDAIFLLGTLRFRTDIFTNDRGATSTTVNQINQFLNNHTEFDALTAERITTIFRIFSLSIERAVDERYIVTPDNFHARSLLALETLAPYFLEGSEYDANFPANMSEIESYRNLTGLYKMRVKEGKLYLIKGENHIVYDESTEVELIGDNTPKPVQLLPDVMEDAENNAFLRSMEDYVYDSLRDNEEFTRLRNRIAEAKTQRRTNGKGA